MGERVGYWWVQARRPDPPSRQFAKKHVASNMLPSSKATQRHTHTHTHRHALTRDSAKQRICKFSLVCEFFFISIRRASGSSVAGSLCPAHANTPASPLSLSLSRSLFLPNRPKNSMRDPTVDVEHYFYFFFFCKNSHTWNYTRTFFGKKINNKKIHKLNEQKSGRNREATHKKDEPKKSNRAIGIEWRKKKFAHFLPQKKIGNRRRRGRRGWRGDD